MFSHNISTMVGTQLHTSDVTTMACQLQEAGKSTSRGYHLSGDACILPNVHEKASSFTFAQ